MKTSTITIVVVAAAVIVGGIFWSLRRPDRSHTDPELTVAIAPYQDLAMLVNGPELRLDRKNGVSLRLVTMAWEDILPSVASAGTTVDVGFGSYAEYLTKYEKINGGASDPVIYVQPLYVYKGGGFIALSDKVPLFGAKELDDPVALRRLTTLRIGAQKESLYDMMLYSRARKMGIEPKELKVFDTPLNDGLLALENGSLDLAAGGLTQITEARKHNGRLVLSMEDAGFADVTGFICRRSTLEKKRALIEALIRTWFQSVDYVYADLEKHSTHSMDYLAKNAATRYTHDEYVQALSQEFLPRSIEELREVVLAPGSKYDLTRTGNSINDYLTANGKVSHPSPLPSPVLGSR